MAVATSYSDLQPVRRIDEAEAARISNKIDEELKVRRAPHLRHSLPPLMHALSFRLRRKCSKGARLQNEM